VGVAVQVSEHEAVVLRTLRYGEADVIGHLFTREQGRRNVIAKGARKSRSRLGVRLEPFVIARVQLREGRGDLGIVQNVSLVAAHEHVRASWMRQQVAAVALDMLGRLSVENAPNEAAFHLTTRFLARLDAPVLDDDAARALLAGYQFKLLHTVGLAPQLGSCTRCGTEDALTAWSAPDGGVVCAACVTGADRSIEPEVHAQAVRAMREPLAQLAEEVAGRNELAAARRLFVTSMCAEHAGFRPRSLEN
jgi:DNA repair protein RecO (recombination protein O)